MNEKKEKLEKLKQKVAINNLFKNCIDADLVDIKDFDDLEIRQIGEFLMKRETYEQRVFCTKEFANLNQWISSKLKLVNISNNIIINILRSDRWMAEIIVKNWENIIDMMLKNGGVSFYDIETKKGVFVGFDEDSCYIDIKQ